MAIRTVYAEMLSTADGASPNVFLTIEPEQNTILRAIRTWLIQFNDPTFTSVGMKLYSDNGGVPGSVIETSSTVWTKAEITTILESEDHGLCEIYFEFDYTSLKEDETYHLVLTVAGYTGTDSSHLGWMRGYPDPTYQTGVDMSFTGLLQSPFEIQSIAAEL